MEIIIKKKINIVSKYDEVFKQISDFNNWKNWSPWHVLDNKTDYTISKKPASVGHKMTWKSEIIGEGETTTQEIFDTEIRQITHSTKPFKNTAESKFFFESKDKDLLKTTDLIWEFRTELPWYLFFKKKLITKLIEKDLDRGLLMLKDFCELGEVHAKTLDLGISSMSCISYIGIERTISFDNLAIAMKDDFEKLTNFLEKENKNSENWFTIYKNYDFAKEEVNYIACFSSEDFDSKQNIKQGEHNFIHGVVPNSRAYKIEHLGDYKHLGNSWTAGKTIIMAKKLREKYYPLEKYINISDNDSAKNLKTEIFFPIK